MTQSNEGRRSDRHDLLAPWAKRTLAHIRGLELILNSVARTLTALLVLIVLAALLIAYVLGHITAAELLDLARSTTSLWA